MSYFKNLSQEQNRLNLKTQKVELGTVDELNKISINIINKSDKIKNLVDKLDSFSKDIKSELNKLSSEQDKLMKKQNEVFNNARELGLNVLDIKEYKKSQEAMNSVRNINNYASDYIK